MMTSFGAALSNPLSVLPASAWNIPGHMLSGAIAYQVLQEESPRTIKKVKAVLEKHPCYANQWQARLQDVPVADHDMVLFMQAARWPDDIRRSDSWKVYAHIVRKESTAVQDLATSILAGS